MATTLIIAFCNYCKKQTPHKLQQTPGSPTYNKEGTGGSLICTQCGSHRIHQIQGFNANLM
jgi:ribosomal protein L44E